MSSPTAGNASRSVESASGRNELCAADGVICFGNGNPSGNAVATRSSSNARSSSNEGGPLSARYAQTSCRVNEVEALLARQRAKVDGLRRLGFHDEADGEQSLLAGIEDLLRLCIKDRDETSREVTGFPVH